MAGNGSSQENIKQVVDALLKVGDVEKITELAFAFEQLLNDLPANDPNRIDWLLQVGEILYQKGQYKDSSRYLQSGLELARTSQLKGKHALALGLLADLQRAQGNYRLSLENLVHARQVLGQNPATDRDVSARLHIIDGLNNMSLGEYESSRTAFYEAYQLYTQLRDQKGSILASNRLGTIHTMLSEYEQAEKYLQESLSLGKQTGDRHAMAGALLNLGEIRRLQQKPAEAKPFYYEAGALFSALGMTRGIAIAENNLGHIAVLLRDYDVAKYHYSHAIDHARSADLVPDMLDTLSGMVFILVHRGQFEEAETLIRFVLGHPAHLQETEEFLQAARREIASQGGQAAMNIPAPEQLNEVISRTLEMVF